MGGVGEFLHSTLAISERDVCQDDIESIERAVDGRDHAERKKVVVKFFDKQKHDSVMTSLLNLSSRFNNQGRPTAGIRLEIPPSSRTSSRCCPASAPD